MQKLERLREQDYKRYEWILEKLNLFYKPVPVYDRVSSFSSGLYGSSGSLESYTSPLRTIFVDVEKLG